LIWPSDKHLDPDDLNALVSLGEKGASDSSRLSEQVLQEAQHHVDSCEDCSRKVQMHKSAQSDISRLRVENHGEGPDCIGEAEWLDVAAGLLPHAQVRELMKHAAQCGHCGPLLKNAVEMLADEAIPGEETLLASLTSARLTWQKSMAKTLVKTTQDPERGPKASRSRVLFSWPGLTWPRLVFPLAAIAVAAVSGWLGYRMLQPLSADQLLAQAYTEHRTLEVRIPGAKYAPLRVERGSGSSNLDKPPALLQAEVLIGEKLRTHPNDPTWLEAKARADLLDGNYESAIKSAQRALETKPDSPSLLTDLGSAYFLRAEAADRAIDYGNAIESLGKALAKSPDDPVALFNRALACERMFLYTQAVDDWAHYLRVDPSGEWASDARVHLERVKQKMIEREKRTAAPLLSPAEFSAAIDANREDAIAVLDRRAEQYLEIATQSWLPLAYGDSGSPPATSVEARRALEYLAEILKNRHDDTWLADFLQSPPSSIRGESLRSQLASDEALHSGRYGLSAELARKSARAFQLSKNQAGMLRADFILMMAQTFAFKTNNCLKTAAAAIPLLSTTRYRWLQSQILIQEGQCQGGGAQVEDAIRSTSKGAAIARRFHYPSLELRAAAFGAVYRSNISSADRGFRDLINGLATFWKSDVASTRGENLYSVLFDFAGTLNWHHVEASAIAEKISDFPVKDTVDQAVGWELLAGAQERTGDYKTALATLRRATAQLETLPDDRGAILRKAEITLENAGILLNLGDPKKALASLAGLPQQFETAPVLFKAAYFKTYGEIYLALGLNALADPQLERALAVTETGLRGLRLEADKLEWSRTEDQIYRDLLEVKLTSATPAQALAWWEWCKGASLRDAATKHSPGLTDSGSQSFAPPEVSGYSLPSGTALISYAVLGNTARVFVFRDGGVHSHALQVPDDQKLQPLRFLSLCADPAADIRFFYAESRRLYDVLVGPLEADIQGATALRFETDGILDLIPFDLLRGADERYLADRFEVTYSPGLAYGLHSKRGTLSPTSVALIVVASETQDPSLPPVPEAAEEGNDVASYFLKANVLAGAEVNRKDVLRNLRAAQVFHFVGHALASVDQVGLVLGPDGVLNSRDLVKAHPRNLRLAVLSACDTANGAEGSFADVNSVARTVAVAGVPQTVASRWKVDSSVTRQLMRAFYSNLMLGKTPADSLRAAAVAIRSIREYQHPYYWGSFAVFGS
jgi:CHAT domain-containing protein/tetratricopeptide (TPR) repeat protein